MTSSRLILAGLLLALPLALHAAEFHVATNGSNTHPGTRKLPWRTIQHAADRAQPGDTITVHAGVYRERINPPRGGTSERQRIVYQAARGETVEIKGSEVVRGWVKLQDDVWQVVLPNAFFGNFNPYRDVIRGDWFSPRGRLHHTGAVYLNGDWLTEAAKLEEVLLPDGAKPAWLTGASGQHLLNVAWWSPGAGADATARVPAAKFAAQQGIQTAACSEGGECVGWIEHGDWVRYEGVDFGSGATAAEFRVASATTGGVIEVRLGSPEGDLLGTGAVKGTGDWQSWTTVKADLKSTRGPQTICLVFKQRPAAAARSSALNPNLWFAQVDDRQTTLWAQFPGVNPNEQSVEINVRQTVFCPDQPGRNFITVRGFVLRHAATPWAPPTAEQIGLLGTHWSRGWIIERNTISHSTCSGIALGKHGDAFDNTSADTAEGYVKTIERAHAFPLPWTRAAIGHHLVRSNTISHCEQAGIVGSLGAAFSTVEGNVIHDIHVRRLFTGAEMAGIKFHGAIDTVLRGNYIHHTCRGLWLDWMAQGTRVSANLFHDNPDQDLFVEVNHGPFLVDNNVFLSSVNLLDVSEGGAYVHNLFAGKIISQPEPNRETPYHPAHDTTVAGLARTSGGDNRFYQNLFVGTGATDTGVAPRTGQAVGSGSWLYDARPLPSFAAGNVYLRGARPSAQEKDASVFAALDPALKLLTDAGRVHLEFTLPDLAQRPPMPLTTSKVLGTARVPGLPYVNPDNSPIQLNTDFLGHRRRPTNPTPGPFETLRPGPQVIPLR